eukprot:CAMPEP_0206233442 /NCGR_PEP_ID=MMETSP0047_2-20121206/11991_1 /ASSEMBLY_ACC=CAM_ASM_000192 /TAXON_ID=195065 /ORGANISM="Chroomonas mesostigmatica_cf, Strain CCMP1168" /LENGTH=140 /DNA_ID=CAMNT_0053657325 /DNA_START=173 /DNA_END=592 /DNA_ORIENTATION=+
MPIDPHPHLTEPHTPRVQSSNRAHQWARSVVGVAHPPVLVVCAVCAVCAEQQRAHEWACLVVGVAHPPVLVVTEREDMLVALPEVRVQLSRRHSALAAGVDRVLVRVAVRLGDVGELGAEERGRLPDRREHACDPRLRAT